MERKEYWVTLVAPSRFGECPIKPYGTPKTIEEKTKVDSIALLIFKEYTSQLPIKIKYFKGGIGVFKKSKLLKAIIPN